MEPLVLASGELFAPARPTRDGEGGRLNTLGPVRQIFGLLPRTSISVFAALSLAEASAAPLLVSAVHASVDRITREPAAGLAFLAFVLGLATLAQRVLADVRGAVATNLGLRAADEAMSLLLQHARRLSGRELDDPAVHDALSRAGAGVGGGVPSVVFSAGSALASGAAIVGTVGALASLSLHVAALCVASLAPTFVAQRHIGRILYSHRRKTSELQRRKDYIALLLADPRTLSEAQLNDLDADLFDRWRTYADELQAGWRGRHRRNALIAVAAGAAAATLVGVGYWRLLAEGGTAGELAAAFAALGLLVSSLGFFAQAWNMLDRYGLPLRDWTTFLTLAPAVGDPPEPVVPPASGSLDLVGVTFCYPSGARALTDVTFTVAPGELLAVVGANGAGKTTLVRMLGRMYDPDAGSIRLAGVDLRCMRLRELRSRLGVLTQDFARLEMPVRDILTLGDAVARPDGDLWDALGLAGVADKIERAGGLDSQLGRLFAGGQDLSGGEWQRVALARLFLQRPAVWILDEPTSGLDPIGEMAIFEVLREQLASRIGIVISHRFSTVRRASKIIVLESGSVAEAGTHDDLMQRDGTYASMFRAQAASFQS